VAPDYAPSPENGPTDVTVTETRTITGPPALVLPSQNTGFRDYNIPETLSEIHDASAYDVPAYDAPVQDVYKKEDDDPPTINYDRNGEGNEPEENKVLRNIKITDDSTNTTPLLGEIQLDTTKNIEEDNVKKVNTV